MIKKMFFILLFAAGLQCANTVELTLHYLNGTFELKHYEDDTEILKILYGSARGREITGISGLEQFTGLKELWLGMTAFVTDYSFLNGLDTIEALVLQDVSVSDTSFLYHMASLKRLVFQGCRINGKIDASRLPSLEYFEFTNSQLVDFPIDIQERRNLDTVNVAYNNLKNIPVDERMGILIIAIGNPINDTAVSERVIVGDGNIYHLLPENYRRYVR